MIVFWILIFRQLPVTLAAPPLKHLQREKYFLHETEGCGINYGQGYSHQLHALACALVESEALKRTLVMPQAMCLLEFHTLGNGRQFKNWTDIIDVEALKPRVRLHFVDDASQFVVDQQNANHSVAYVAPDAPHATVKKMGCMDVIVRMHRHWPDSPRWWYPCLEDPSSRLQQHFNALKGLLRPVNATLAAAEEIRRKLGPDYCSLHVRRGDKLPLHPGLDEATQPDAILKKISTACPPGHTLFLASNEDQEGFFSPLGEHYELYTYRNFSDVLQDIGALGGANSASDKPQDVVDNLLLYQIEAAVLENAPKIWMDTFCFLYTAGCDEGVNARVYGVSGFHGLVG